MAKWLARVLEGKSALRIVRLSPRWELRKCFGRGLSSRNPCAIPSIRFLSHGVIFRPASLRTLVFETILPIRGNLFIPRSLFSEETLAGLDQKLESIVLSKGVA